VDFCCAATENNLKSGRITRMNASLSLVTFRQKATLYFQLVRLDKPIGILLLLWPTLIALWIAAKGIPDPLVLFVFVTGVILMRSAGCAINDYADRHIDGKVKRTTARPLASGKISEKETLIVFATLSLIAFLLVLLMNRLTIMMSFVGIALAVSYPFMKRYHYLPQVHLGAAFGWAAPMAYAAQANEVNVVTWLIFLATILWATVYDTMYAMVDYDDDIKIGVKSTAILFGNQDKLIIGLTQVLLIFNLILIGNRAELGLYYYLGVFAASLFSIYQQYLIKDRDRALCFKAFLNNNWFGLVLFIGVLLDYQFAGS
jgi:4-hydroxybenzoate polyprenyltransferase